MTKRAPWSRRRLIGATLATTGLAIRAAAAQEAANGDRGLGGTGVAPPDPEHGDRGIGGTGVIGTIRGFGSILVNDLRVAFPRTVTVRIDGRPAHLRDLAIGHVVHVLARRNGAQLTTRLIEAVSEVSGPIDAVGPEGISVLGQTVVIPDARPPRRWKARGWVSVSGLRRLDGTIVASRVERRPSGLAQVVGVPRLDPDGSARLGHLALDGYPADVEGQRLLLTGHVSGGRLVVAEARPLWTNLLAARPERLSFEDYVAPHGREVRFGSGLPPTSDVALGDMGGETRAVVSASVAPSGQIEVLGIRAEGHTRRSGFRSPAAERGVAPDESPGRRPDAPEAPGGIRRGDGAAPGAGTRNPPAGAPSSRGLGGPGGGPSGGSGPGGGHGSRR